MYEKCYIKNIKNTCIIINVYIALVKRLLFIVNNYDTKIISYKHIIKNYPWAVYLHVGLELTGARIFTCTACCTCTVHYILRVHVVCTSGSASYTGNTDPQYCYYKCTTSLQLRIVQSSSHQLTISPQVCKEHRPLVAALAIAAPQPCTKEPVSL